MINSLLEVMVRYEAVIKRNLLIPLAMLITIHLQGASIIDALHVIKFSMELY